nr:MAG: ORF1 [Torque teno midi virus]
MPFWWNRRKKPWYGWRFKTRRYRRRRWPRRRRRTLYKRRRTRRANRRRRRRKYKVKRKKKQIIVRQWQPQSIRKCKITGIEPLVVGAEGAQIDCYTLTKTDYVPPKVPWGGGFGIENFSLKYLYSEYSYHNNYWTSSNSQKDLCRYMGCKITVFRHDYIDFILSYDTQPPHVLNKYTFPACHPHQQLLQKHHKIILSKLSNPNGKYHKTFRIRPPKQMLSKWFFTKAFAPHSLVVLKVAAANFRHANLSGKNTNMLVSLHSLNLSFYKNPDWAQQKTSGPYMPYNQIQNNLQYVVVINKVETQKTMSLTSTSSYSDSIDYDKGWFNPMFLQAKYIGTKGSPTATHQIIAARYNPNIDDGVGNQIYCVSTLASTYDPPRTDKQLLIEGLPLWLGLYGYYSFVKAVKTEDFLKAHVIVLSSKSLYCYPEIGSCTRYVFIDFDYITGKKPYDQVITTQQKKLWYPDMHWQKKSMNAIVESGPFIPKLSEETYSTWEINSRYSFYFKWGGAQTDEPNIKNPEELPTYDVPDSMPKAIQIVNPEKQAPETILHPWDYRRGFIKEKALKRMCTNLETDSEFQYSPETTPKKKQRMQATLPNPQQENQEIKSCLLSLCEENTWQEAKEGNLQQLIQQQQQQQQKVKYNMLKLLIDLKEKQRMLQYHTGLLD